MGYSRSNSYDWPAYVPVAKRREQAAKLLQSMQKKGQTLNPIVIEGRGITKTFWGKAWCENLEAYSDFANRLPRGRTYVRNGSVIDLKISNGQVQAKVMGSSLYQIGIKVKPMLESKWKVLIEACAGKIDSLIELLQGKFSKAVMEILTQKENGLFPNPKEISMSCSCPDYAGMCKHIAAVLYGVGAFLDTKPEWLFVLRHVDHLDLIASASSGDLLLKNQTSDHVLEDGDLSALFGIELDTGKTSPKKTKTAATRKTKSSSANGEKAKKLVGSKSQRQKKRPV